MKKDQLKIFRFLLLYACCIFAVGLFQSEMVIIKMEPAMRSLARFSAYTSLLMSAVFTSVLIGAVFILSGLLIKDQKLKIARSLYCKSITAILIILIIGEAFKFVWLAFSYPDDVHFLILSNKLEQDIAAMPSVQAARTIQIVFTIGSAVAMFLTLKSTKVPFKDRVLASLIMIAFFCLYSSLYLLK